MSDISHNLERRILLKHFRDQMASHPKAAMLSQGITALNVEMDAETEAVGEAIREGRATMKDLFLLIDYPPWGKP
jgi:hypothetical protein